MEAQASPVGERASPAPNQSSGFTSAGLNPKGRGDPWGFGPPPSPGSDALLQQPERTDPRIPWDGWREREQPPRKARSLPPALSPSPSSVFWSSDSSP